MNDTVLVDSPSTHVRRLTLNRPEKRNALSHALRSRLFELLRDADADRAAALIERHMAEFDAQIRAAVSRRLASPLTA